MPLQDFLNLLERYTGATASNPPASSAQDFEKVAESAPQNHLAEGLAQAFRSNQTPPFANMITNLFSQSNGQQRADLVNHLLSAAGPTIGSLAGGGLLSSLLGGGSQVSAQQAEQVSPETVQQLADHAEKNDPSIIDRVSSLYAQHPQMVQVLGAGAMALVLSHLSKKA